MTSSTVLLVRHGRTVLNAEDRLRGLADPELDATGIAQAEATAAALAPYRLEYVASSPLQRAVVTAEIVAAPSGAPHAVDPGFNDRDYGEWTGHPRADVVAEFGSVDAAPGVEPSDRVRDRATAALDALAARGDYSTFAVVTHDAVIRLRNWERSSRPRPATSTPAWTAPPTSWNSSSNSTTTATCSARWSAPRSTGWSA
ncbi:MAG: histidine phosphatase family protein [Gordonia sp. (in: high G+C Gram-positive bacteria)]